MCGRKVSFLSNMTPKNFASFLTGIFCLYSDSSGFLTHLFLLQKCTTCVLEVENL